MHPGSATDVSLLAFNERVWEVNNTSDGRIGIARSWLIHCIHKESCATFLFPKTNIQDHKENDRRRKFYEDAASSGKPMLQYIPEIGCCNLTAAFLKQMVSYKGR